VSCCNATRIWSRRRIVVRSKPSGARLSIADVLRAQETLAAEGLENGEIARQVNCEENRPEVARSIRRAAEADDVARREALGTPADDSGLGTLRVACAGV